MKEVNEYSPNFEKITEDSSVYIRDNAVEVTNKGNTLVYLDDVPLEPDEAIRTNFSKIENVCVWSFYARFGNENVLDESPVKKCLRIIRTNFHDALLSNYKAKS